MSRGKVIDIPGLAPHTPPNPQAVRDAHWRTTDIANAATFVDEHVDTLRFTERGLGWHNWIDGRWKSDITQFTLSLGAETVTRWWVEVGTAGSPEERQILAGHFLKSAQRARLEAMLSLAEADRRIALPPDAFDRDPWLLTVANGTVDLRTGELRRHDPTDLISKRSSVAYDPAARCPRFLEFVNLIFNGKVELVSFVQRAAGYSATGSIQEQCLFFCWGSGANGKSTLLAIFHMVLGEHAKVAVPSLLMAQKHEQHPTEIADLLGARLVSAIETEQDRRMAEVKVKWLTGDKTLKGRFMRRDFFEFEATHKFWLAGNHKPVVQGTDAAIWRRIHLVPFTINLEEKLKDNLVRDFAFSLTDELPGILAWIVEGAMHWYADGLRPPDIVRAATADYRAEMDVVAQWVAEACERAERAYTPFKVLYDAYATEFRQDAKSKLAFGQELDRLGIHRDTVGGMAVRKGVRLRAAAQEERRNPYAD